MPYEISVSEREGNRNEIVNVTCKTKKQAVSRARELCSQYEGKSVFVSYWNMRNGIDCFLDDSGNKVIVGRDWNKFSF